MSENHEPADLPRRLQLERNAPAPMTERLRSRGVQVPPAGAEEAAKPPQDATQRVRAAQAGGVELRAIATSNQVPGAVLAIGLYQCGRAVVLAVMFSMMLADPHSHGYSDGFWMAFYVLSNGAMAVTPFLPLTIVYALAVGTSLWLRAAWGRWALIATSAWAIFRLGDYLIFYQSLDLGASASDVEIAHLSFLREAALLLAFVNIGLGVYLAFAPGVAKAFRQQKPSTRTRPANSV